MLESPQTALNSANAAIDVDPFNAKCYYRKYQALEALGQYEDAMSSLHEANKIEPKNKDIKRAMTKVMNKYN